MGRENLRVRGKRGCFTHEREIEKGWGGGGESCVKEKRKMFYTSFRSKTFYAWEGFFLILFIYFFTV